MSVEKSSRDDSEPASSNNEVFSTIVNKKRKSCEETEEKSVQNLDAENTVEIAPENGSKRMKLEKLNLEVNNVDETSARSSEPCCSTATVDNVLEDMEEEIGTALEQPCFKNKLTPKNVKSILRHIIANEYVLNMVRNTMKPSELGAIEYEPKLTRSKAKEMRKNQFSLPWPVASPAKTAQKVSKKLLEEEFPDESSGDEDYKPNEEECRSEDEVGSSKHGTPRRDQSLCSSPVSKTTEHMSEDESALFIALPELEAPVDSSEADKIALRTRSKLCLNDTPLEEIEASLVAPDITMDMYAVHCDDKDWQSFLSELMKPIDSTSIMEHHDDAENDPEYKAVEEDAPDYDDLRYEQITTDEWNDLMLGTYELAQEDLSFLDDEDEEEEPRIDVEFTENVPTLPEINIEPKCIENVRSIWMIPDERVQLDEQLRMYVQLLTQSYLMSHENPALKNLNVSTKILLEELKMFSNREMATGKKSAFYSQNLDGALAIVNEFENIHLPENSPILKQAKQKSPPVPHHIQKTLASSKVFIYPELLPTCGFHRSIKPCKGFNNAEDNLIALGLEQFSVLSNPIDCIQKYLVPTKSIEQIKARIRNFKRKKDSLTNPIKYYYEHYKAPKFQRVIRIFDPGNIKAPEEYPKDSLPKWMESYSKFSKTNTVGNDPPSTPPNKDPLQLKKYKPILPQGLNFSSLFQAHPFLKKYSRRRRRHTQSKRCFRLPPILRPKPDPKSIECQKNSDTDGCVQVPSADSRVPHNIQRGTRTKASVTHDQDNHTQSVHTVPQSVNAAPKIPHNTSVQSVSTAKTAVTHNQGRHTRAVIVASKVPNDASNQCVSTSKSAVSHSQDRRTQSVHTVPQTQFVKAATKVPHTASVRKISTSKTTGSQDSATLPDLACGTVDEALMASKVDAADTGGKQVVGRRKSRAAKARSPKRKKKVRRNQPPKDFEASLALLQSPVVKDVRLKEDREIMFANSYLLRATEILKGDPEVKEKFLSTLCKYHLSSRSPVELYSELKEVLKDYPALVRDFVVFLRPEQAKECGKYKDHIALSKIREFFKKIEMHFKNEPEHINLIVRTFAHLHKKVDTTSSEVISALQPLLKGQDHLMKELNHLLSTSD